MDNIVSYLYAQKESLIPFLAVIVFIFLDVCSGFTTALFRGELSSKKMRKGILNKIGEIMAMVLMYTIGKIFPLLGLFSYDLAKLLPNALGVYIVMMEVWSIVENLKGINPEIGDEIEELLKKEERK